MKTIFIILFYTISFTSLYAKVGNPVDEAPIPYEIQIGGTLLCNGMETKLFCLEEIADIRECTKLKLVTHYDRLDWKDIVEIADGDLKKIEEAPNFFTKSRFERKHESNFQAFNSATTVLGKLLFGGVFYPRAIYLDARDAKKERKALREGNQEAKKAFLIAVDHLTNPENQGESLIGGNNVFQASEYISSEIMNQDI